jgi:hypothetical protein
MAYKISSGNCTDNNEEKGQGGAQIGNFRGVFSFADMKIRIFSRQTHIKHNLLFYSDLTSRNRTAMWDLDWGILILLV